MNEPLIILVAGPYRSGTGDDPARIAANHAAIRRACLELFRAGHLPVNGEDLALPLAELAGSRTVGDAAFDEVFHPMGRRRSSVVRRSTCQPLASSSTSRTTTSGLPVRSRPTWSRPVRPRWSGTSMPGTLTNRP